MLWTLPHQTKTAFHNNNKNSKNNKTTTTATTTTLLQRRSAPSPASSHRRSIGRGRRNGPISLFLASLQRKHYVSDQWFSCHSLSSSSPPSSCLPGSPPPPSSSSSPFPSFFLSFCLQEIRQVKLSERQRGFYFIYLFCLSLFFVYVFILFNPL